MTWTQILNLVSTSAFVVAVLFAVLQFRQANKVRSEATAIELVRSIQNEGWTDSYVVLTKIEESLRTSLDSEQETAVYAIGIRLETLGYLVFSHMIEIRVVDDLVGGACRKFWKTLAPWIIEERRKTNNLKSFEWVQWLAERLDEIQPSPPAYEAHRTWRMLDI